MANKFVKLGELYVNPDLVAAVAITASGGQSYVYLSGTMTPLDVELPAKNIVDRIQREWDRRENLGE